MIAPFPLYVDEISADKVKATASKGNTVFHNFKMLLSDMPFPVRNPFADPSYRKIIADRFGKEINGISIIPIGRFICMWVRNKGTRGMIMLDLTGKAALAERMAEKLEHADLRERFMEVYREVISHPEKHNRFRLVVVGAENLQ